MSFLAPAALWLYLLVPVLVAAYVWMLRRPARERVIYSSLDLVAKAARAGGHWRRHVPAILYLATLCGVIFTLARPTAPVPVPDNRTVVMLSIDVSRSMMATDVNPNRLEAAKTAAVAFVHALPVGTHVGLVSFSSYATLVTPPTADHDRVIQAISNLDLEFATAIGDGLLEAVYALPGRTRSEGVTNTYNPYAPPPGPALTPDEIDRLPPATVVLMSDGQSNRGVPPEQAAVVAKEFKVKVYTIGLGAPEGTFLELGGHSIFVRLDEETLKEIAQVTGGTYQRVTTARDLSRVYTHLGRVIGWERRPTEVSGLASVGIAAMFIGTLVVSLLWMHRLG
ncbi:MAG TPA: VWA domain-containing protein [bacterium]|nr:VWA domain-containing protein [bacterium]